jgi:cell wall-associated NlpC family hydrolase
VKSKVATLYHQAEQASERYNAATIALHKGEARLAALRADLSRQRAKVDRVRRHLASLVVAQYQGQALTSTTQVLLSKSPDKFLNELSTVSQYNEQQTQLMADFAVQAKQLAMRKKAAFREVAQLAATKKKLAADKATIDKKAAAAKALLSKLKKKAAAAAAAAAAADEARPSRSAERVPLVNVPASGRAAAAVNFAMAQVGKPYVYGAAGPDAYDCSGLTMAAWAQAGVSLPHSAAAQMSYGTPVSASQLQPGDLVFYYQPVSHVGMYIGNGQIVNAENPSTGVVVAGLYSMPYSGAVRPG